MIKILSEFDKRKFKIKLHVQLSKVILILIAICLLSIGAVIALDTDYKNQFACVYSAVLLLMISFAQIQTAFYGEVLKCFSRLNFSRKQYYSENILLLLAASGTTSVVISIAIMINKIAYNREQVICFWYRFSRVDFISITQIIILNFVIVTVIYFLANLIAIICIGKARQYNFATIILILTIISLCVANTFWKGNYFNIMSGFIEYNKSYGLYLIGLLLIAFLEYYIGKKMFMKKDID